MEQAIAETTRRRLAQETFNKEHGITPQTIKKKIKDIAPSMGNTVEGHNMKKIRKDRVKELIRELEEKMEIAVQNLEFEKAADLRDEIEMLKDQALK